jgi:WD40 repeat protein
MSGTKPVQQAFFNLDDNTGWASKVAFSNNGAWMASIHGRPSNTLLLWKLTDGDMRIFATQRLPRIGNVAFHPDNRTLIFGANAGHMFDITDKGLVRTPRTLAGANSCFTFADAGKTFACVVFNQARNGQLYGSEVKFWNLADNQVVESRLIQQERSIKALALSPDGKTLVTGSLDLRVRFWDLTAQPPTAAIPFSTSSWLKGLHFSADGAYLIAVGSASDVILWNVKAGKQEKAWRFTRQGIGAGSPLAFSAVAFAPDGRHVAISTYEHTTIVLRLPIRR